MTRPLAFLSLIPLILSAQDQQPGSIQGRVTNSLTGEPVSGATVTLFPTLGRTDQQTSSSQADGVFRFEEVPPGAYALSASMTGFVPGNGTLELQKVSVNAGQNITGLSIQMTPHSSISGKVLDDAGQPVSGAQVHAYAPFAFGGHIRLRHGQSTTSGKNGDYLLKGFSPGNFYLAAEPPQGSKDLVRTFYPKSLDVENATVVEMAAGQSLTKVNIALRRTATYHVRGRIAGFADQRAESATVSLAPHGTIDADTQGRIGHTGPDGSFDLSNVLPGSYTLWVNGIIKQDASKRGSRRWLLARQDLDVGADDVNDLVLSVIPPVTLHGTLTFDGGIPQISSRPRILLFPAGEGSFGSMQNVAVGQDETFAIENLDPGRYLVRVQGVPTRFYLKAVLWNRQDVTQSGVDLMQGGPSELEIVLREGAGTIRATISGAPSGLRTTVILVPDMAEPNGANVISGVSQADGTFTMKGLAPGDYFGFAVERWTTMLQDGTFLREMQNQGTKFEVSENQTTQITLPAFSAEQMRQTAVLLGRDPQ